MGPKAAEMLRLIPDTKIDVIERCSGHGGTFGVMKDTFEIGRKVGRPAMRAVIAQNRGHVASDCPLAAAHLMAGAADMAANDGKTLSAKAPEHPIEIFARACGLREHE
jgi:glycerol-3-phosphate dehydrogenase subunit C